MNCNTKPEILAPVGNFDMLTAAVRSGADAVYFGAKNFSARRNAQNFTLEEMKQVIDYCHIRGVKAYLTLNILLKDEEISEAFELAKTAYNYGIDAIIIQDLGLAKLLHKNIPNLPLHASTQLSVHSPSALAVLKKLGFCQVVTAREMSFDELEVFCAEAKKQSIAVEVFVHGALCMSVSGQCLLSAFLGSRSGNRGLCAGPCRLPFAAPGGTGYDLSLKDLSMLDYLGKLSEIGVASFKIEGRMKRPEYVAAATTACRMAVDNGVVEKSLAETLKNVFSRSGFTDGYLKNRLGKEMFGIRTKDDVVSAETAFPALHEYYRSERRSVKISVSVKIVENEEISLTLSDGKNIVTAYGGIPQNAENRPVDRESIEKNLNKFGSTPYFAENISVDLGEGLFVRMSDINDLRRTACEMLDNKRTELPYEKSTAVYTPEFEDSEHLKTPKLYIRIENSAQLPDNLGEADGLIVPLEENPDINIEKQIERIVDIPRGIISEEAIVKRLELFSQYGFKSALCGNIAAINLAEKCGFTVFADTGLNIYNSESAATAHALGAVKTILSNEILLTDAKKIKSPIPKGIVAYGNIPLMLFKNCPLKNGIKCSDCDKNGVITDRKGIDFPVRCRMGYSELLNSIPIWLADRMGEMAGLDFIVLYFTRETKSRAQEVIDAYKNGSTTDVKYTRGLFYRGTK